MHLCVYLECIYLSFAQLYVTMSAKQKSRSANVQHLVAPILMTQ